MPHAPLQSSLLSVPAREYCALMEHMQGYKKTRRWLQHVATLLPSLRARASILGRHWVPRDSYQLPNDDLRFETFMRLQELLGADQRLWQRCTEHDVQQKLCHGLADDLTDIYFDLKHGLTLLAQHPELPDYALSHWANSYHAHWQQHALHAEQCLDAMLHHDPAQRMRQIEQFRMV